MYSSAIDDFSKYEGFVVIVTICADCDPLALARLTTRVSEQIGELPQEFSRDLGRLPIMARCEASELPALAVAAIGSGGGGSRLPGLEREEVPLVLLPIEAALKLEHPLNQFKSRGSIQIRTNQNPQVRSIHEFVGDGRGDLIVDLGRKKAVEGVFRPGIDLMELCWLAVAEFREQFALRRRLRRSAVSLLTRPSPRGILFEVFPGDFPLMFENLLKQSQTSVAIQIRAN
jgi:hypothetical protein